MLTTQGDKKLNLSANRSILLAELTEKEKNLLVSKGYAAVDDFSTDTFYQNWMQRFAKKVWPGSGVPPRSVRLILEKVNNNLSQLMDKKDSLISRKNYSSIPYVGQSFIGVTSIPMGHGIISMGLTTFGIAPCIGMAMRIVHKGQMIGVLAHFDSENERNFNTCINQLSTIICSKLNLDYSSLTAIDASQLQLKIRYSEMPESIKLSQSLQNALKIQYPDVNLEDTREIEVGSGILFDVEKGKIYSYEEKDQNITNTCIDRQILRHTDVDNFDYFFLKSNGQLHKLQTDSQKKNREYIIDDPELEAVVKERNKMVNSTIESSEKQVESKHNQTNFQNISQKATTGIKFGLSGLIGLILGLFLE